ncbi:AmiS/UreI family transporter [Homoserinimonas aerilata]|uniref:AmiS/UreI family transporter n=1 Tax=Homoserinimonas aerilata TaxID=1162970 RepID=A0A542YF63_9MICO|nr:AmiS/UreI family transporter [Homoserinimonas aerilata]TQL46735.1 AmiS/UreI family transporter [Homoserinimonas aerilata]
MGNIGLLFVGIVLLVNGLNSLGVVPARSAAILNLFVGTMQVVLPTIILIQNGSDAAVVSGTWPTYLFGFTYLYFGLGILLKLEPEGFGWFSAFVAALAFYHAIISVAGDPVYAVIWLTWGIMWTLFFLLLALGRSSLTRFTGWFLVLLGIPSCSLPALLLINGVWSTSPAVGVFALALLAAATALAVALTRSSVFRDAARVEATPSPAVVAEPA